MALPNEMSVLSGNGETVGPVHEAQKRTQSRRPSCA